MQIGINCFNDNQIVSMVMSNNVIGNCEITGYKDCIVYDSNDDNYLEEYFEEIIDVFTTKDKLYKGIGEEKTNYLKNFLLNWNIFKVGENEIEKILISVCKNRYSYDKDKFEQKVGIRETFDVDYLEKNCILKNYSWSDFCCYIKNINRFYAKHFNFIQFNKLLKNMEITFKKSELTLFRSRINDKANINGYPKERMGSPPIEMIVAGRTNSEGIQCLYLSSDFQTTFHEIRAREFDYISVGEFELIKNITIVDLSLFDEIGPFSSEDFDMTWFAINIDIIRNIGNEIARPISRYDSYLDYVPTQYICDYIKHLGYDGIKYKSTLHKDGFNYAIFDEKKFKCQNVQVYNIKDIVYDFIPHSLT